MRVLMLVLLAVVMAACSATPTVAPATNPPAPITSARRPHRPSDGCPRYIRSDRGGAHSQPCSRILARGRCRCLGQDPGRIHQTVSTITVTFDPTNPTDYNATLQTQLTTGTGPDLFFVRSFDVGRGLYTGKYVASVKDLPA